MTYRQEMSPAEFIAWNESMIAKYHPTKYHQSSNLIVRWIEARRTARILALLRPRTNDRILDVGCGAGDILERIPRGQLFGIDISENLVHEARRRLGSRAMIMCGNAEDVDKSFPGQTFDAIYCSEVLEHVQHPSRVVSSIAQLAHPTTRVVISLPHERLINACKQILMRLSLMKLFFGNIIAHKMDDEWHLHTFSHHDSLAICREAGLRVLRVYGIPFRWLPLRFVLLTVKQ